jgi:hypothetical protein
LYECQKKGLTKIAFRNSLILKGAILVVLGWTTVGMAALKENGSLSAGQTISRTPNAVFYSVNYTSS